MGLSGTDASEAFQLPVKTEWFDLSVFSQMKFYVFRVVTVFLAGRENVSYYLMYVGLSLRQRKEPACTKAEGDDCLPPSALSLIALMGQTFSSVLKPSVPSNCYRDKNHVPDRD